MSGSRGDRVTQDYRHVEEAEALATGKSTRDLPGRKNWGS